LLKATIRSLVDTMRCAVELQRAMIDQLPEMRSEALVRAFLVRAHEMQVARHIGGEDRRDGGQRALLIGAKSS
jgi:hypothetical protein